MKLSFVAAALLISALMTDAQYPNQNAAPLPAYPNQNAAPLPAYPNQNAAPLPAYPNQNLVPLPAGYPGNPNPQYSAPPPLSSFLNNLWSQAATFPQNLVGMIHDILGSFKDWLGARSDPYNRPYPPSNQAYYNPPVPSSQVGASSYNYNAPPLPPLPPLASSQVSNNAPPPANSLSNNVGMPAPPQNSNNVGMPAPPQNAM